MSSSKSLNENKFFAENKYILLTFFLALLIYGITYALRDVFPFGDQIVLKVDLYHQYAPFHEELRSRILNGQSLFYSWEGGLGKEFLVQAAYYTASPLSIFILLFNQHTLPEALAIFIILKIAFCGAFFSYYLKKTFNRNDLTIVIFGLLYAFSSYICGYYWNVMWLDAVALFPIVALGIQYLVDEGRHMLYLVSLALVILINFYIAFIVCIFAVLYFIAYIFSNYTIKKDSKLIWDRMVKFGIISLLAGGISMFLTIPTVIALSHTATSDSSFPRLEIYENIYQLITNHFVGARPVVLARNEDLPNVYSGVVTMMLVPFYFFNRKINSREKWWYGGLLVFMLVCACVKPLDYLIHGAHFPSNLPHRYTFIYSFVLIMIAYKALLNIKEIKFDIVYKAFIFYAVIIGFTEYILVPNYSEIDRVLSGIDVFINAILMLVYMVLLYYIRNAKRSELKAVVITLLVFVGAEALFSSYEGLDRTTGRESYVQYIDGTNEAVDYLDEKENNNFYRTEFRRFTTINDAALYHYNGFSQFSSMAPGGISEMIGDLGIAATGNSYRYYDPTPLVDAMFDLKYVMNKSKENDDGTWDGEIKNERYEKLDEFDDGRVWVYENSKVLPLGFMVNSEIKDWDTKDSMPFDVQNDFIEKTTGIQEKMFTDIPLSSFDYTYMNITEKVSENVYKYELTSPAILSNYPTVTAKIHSDQDQYLYIYVDAGNTKQVHYITDTADEKRELSAGKSLFDIGHVSAGEDITVTFELTNKGEFERTYRKDGTVKIYAASYHDEVFEQAYEKLKDQPFEITDFKDTRITGNINAANDGVMFTSIPYVPGWSVKLDGQKVDKVSIGKDGLIGVDVTQGEHEIVFKYQPSGFYLGIIISIVSLMLTVVYTLFTKRKNSSQIEIPVENAQ